MEMNQILTPQEIQQYEGMGYSKEDIQNTINEFETENKFSQAQQQAQVNKSPTLSSNSLVKSKGDDNLIQWQLELDSILERMEHMLRGDKPKTENGSIIWSAPITNEEKIMTDFGVSEIMRILSNYVNRNTILSNYREDVINEKMLDIGNEFSDLIYLKYEVMFATMSFDECKNKLFPHIEEASLTDDQMRIINNEIKRQALEKRKLYPIIVRELVDICHSSYLRALNGGERESLRESRQVNQNEALGGGVNINNSMPRATRGILNPMRYIGGKYT